MLLPVTLIEGVPEPGEPEVQGGPEEPVVRSSGKSMEKLTESPGRTQPVRIPPPPVLIVPREPPPLLGAQTSAGQSGPVPGQTSA